MQNACSGSVPWPCLLSPLFLKSWVNCYFLQEPFGSGWVPLIWHRVVHLTSGFCSHLTTDSTRQGQCLFVLWHILHPASCPLYGGCPILPEEGISSPLATLPGAIQLTACLRRTSGSQAIHEAQVAPGLQTCLQQWAHYVGQHHVTLSRMEPSAPET